MQELKENNQGHSHSLLSEDRQGEVIVKEGLRGIQPNGKRFYIESYGCQMNFSDSEIVALYPM